MVYTPLQRELTRSPCFSRCFLISGKATVATNEAYIHSIDGDKKPRQTPFAWLAFLAGERSCIGQRFAMLEMKAVLATLLTRFELRELPGAPAPQPSLHVTLRPSPALRLRLRSRRKRA